MKLNATPATLPGGSRLLAPGLHRVEGLARGGGRATWLRVPPLATTRPATLAVLLHGAGADPEQGLAMLGPAEAAPRLIVLAPASVAYSWDAVIGDWGADAANIDAALQWVFARCVVDPRRVCIGGFSDGASYALGLGLANGGLFSRIVALSPGFVPPVLPEGHPQVFVSHGAQDGVLPVERCSRVIVPRLVEAGYETRYEEFEGGHEVPAAVSRAALDWLLR